MRRTTFLSTVCSLLITFLVTGCRTVVYRAETTLHADGKARRAISQLWSETPESVRDPKKWRKDTFAAEETLDDRGRSIPLADLPPRLKDKEHPYFVAWQDFASVNDIPDHVLFQPALKESKLPPGRLVRDYGRTDHVLVVEHRWKESLTDSWSQHEMRLARRELSDLVVAVAEDVFNDVLGAEYDGSSLFKWLRAEAQPWAVELTDAVFLYAAAGPGKASPEKVLEEWRQFALAGACSSSALASSSRTKNSRRGWRRMRPAFCYCTSAAKTARCRR